MKEIKKKNQEPSGTSKDQRQESKEFWELNSPK